MEKLLELFKLLIADDDKSRKIKDMLLCMYIGATILFALCYFLPDEDAADDTDSIECVDE